MYREEELFKKVTNGRALLKAAINLQPDMVLLDISMPELAGLEAGRRLKANLPAADLFSNKRRRRHSR